MSKSLRCSSHVISTALLFLCCCNNGVLHRRVDYCMASGNLLLLSCSDVGATRTATTIQYCSIFSRQFIGQNVGDLVNSGM